MRFFCILVVILIAVNQAFGQQSRFALDGISFDASKPVEVTADTLTVEQIGAKAIFQGNAKAVQGGFRIFADRITVFYDDVESMIARILADGDVILTNEVERLEAEHAEYRLQSKQMILTGNVLLLQGANTISGDKLLLDMVASSAIVSGNVKIIFTP